MPRLSVEADRADATAVAFEASLGIIEARAFKEKEPNPPRIQHEREDGGSALRRSEADRQGLAAFVHHQSRAWKACPQLP